MSEPRVRLEFERSGGPAAFTLGTSVDEAELSDEELAELERLIEEAGTRPAGPGLVDRFQYDLTITRGDDVTHLVLGENELATPVLRALRDRLLDRARRGD